MSYEKTFVVDLALCNALKYFKFLFLRAPLIVQERQTDNGRIADSVLPYLHYMGVSSRNGL